MDWVEIEYSTYIKPHLCAFGFTAAGVYIVTPLIMPQLRNVPGIGGLTGDSTKALLAGTYALAGSVICTKMGWVV